MENKFGNLKLTVKGTSNGSGFDILYGFEKNHNFVEFQAKKEFYFIQPWMQFPSKEYSEECMRVSIELVSRFNDFPLLKQTAERLQQDKTQLLDRIEALEKRLFEIQNTRKQEVKL